MLSLHSSKAFSIFCILTVFLSIFSLVPFISQVQANGEDFLEGWDWRKSHLIQPSVGAGTLYQIKLTAYYGSGADTSTGVYLDSESQTDFEDVRFTDNDGSTLLDHWIYERSNSSYCIFWVEVADDLSSDAVIIYIYYGNALVGSTSNGVDTFLQFDDFEGYSEAQNLDGVGIWDATTYASSWQAQGLYAWGGSDFGGYLYMSNNYWQNLYTVPIAEQNGVAYGFRHYRNANDGHAGYYTLKEGATKVATAWDTAGSVKTHNGATYVEMDPELDWAYQTWMETEIRAYFNASNQVFQVEYDGDTFVHVGASLQVNITVGLTQFNFWNQRYGGGHDRVGFDNFYVRKWVAPEPEQDSFGDAEYKPKEFITFYNQTNSVFMTDGIKRANGTSIISSNGTVLELQGIINKNYTFMWFDWTSANASINPYNYTIAGNSTIWLMVDPVGEGGGLSASWVLSGFLLLIFVVTPLVIIVLRRR